MKEMLDALRERGYTVTVTHGRLTERDRLVVARRPVADRQDVTRRYAAPLYMLRSEGEVPHPCGGQTVVKVADSKTEYVGVATCSPHENFVKRIGFVKACGRLRSQLLAAGVIEG